MNTFTVVLIVVLAISLILNYFYAQESAQAKDLSKERDSLRGELDSIIADLTKFMSKLATLRGMKDVEQAQDTAQLVKMMKTALDEAYRQGVTDTQGVFQERINGALGSATGEARGYYSGGMDKALTRKPKRSALGDKKQAEAKKNALQQHVDQVVHNSMPKNWGKPAIVSPISDPMSGWLDSSSNSEEPPPPPDNWFDHQ